MGSLNGCSYAIGTRRTGIGVASHAVAGVTYAQSPVLATLAGGASGGVSNEAAAVAVQFLGTWDTYVTGILVEAWEAWTSGNSIDREGSCYSVIVLEASSTDIGGTGAAVGTSDYRRRR